MVRLGLLSGAALLAGALVAVAGSERGMNAQSAAATARVPVVVELFTSEGCSDCPPADAVLQKLATQPVPGVQIIALGEHVDYWDKQGWRDPFSSGTFSLRQADYAHALRIESPYTPQMIVNGRDEFVGSRYGSATDAIARAAREPSHQLRVSLTADPISGGTLPVRVAADVPAGTSLRAAADVFIAVTEDGLESHVSGGENRGKNLRHVAVVRSLTRIGGISANAATWAGDGEIVIARGWSAGNVHVAAFVQEHQAGAILGAAVVPVP